MGGSCRRSTNIFRGVVHKTSGHILRVYVKDRRLGGADVFERETALILRVTCMVKGQKQDQKGEEEGSTGARRRREKPNNPQKSSKIDQLESLRHSGAMTSATERNGYKRWSKFYKRNKHSCSTAMSLVRSRGGQRTKSIT